MADGGITRIEVEGFKSLAKKTSIELRPLTILAGANSSGKSSIMQPLLLFKQTMAAPFDPGTFLLNGPHARFTSASQILSKGKRRFTFGVTTTKEWLESTFVKVPNGGFFTERARSSNGEAEGRGNDVDRERFWMRRFEEPEGASPYMLDIAPKRLLQAIDSAIHLPGLRGNPERTYPLTGLRAFVGTFDRYAPTIMQEWNHDSRLVKIGGDLNHLGLASTVKTNRVNDAEIEVLVDRTARSQDMVSLADVGIGVSQVLPVLVGLRYAQPDQLVYIEQPEIHLHPRAQHALAKPFAEAANRKVTTVVETHSSLFLIGIQSLIAKGELDPSLVILHWFERNPKTGISNVTSVSPDKAGVFENWPVDFDDVSLNAEREFLDASFRRSKKK